VEARQFDQRASQVLTIQRRSHDSRMPIDSRRGSLSASATSLRTRTLAHTAQDAGQALRELNVARGLQRIDNGGELARREDEVHAFLVDIRPAVISRIERVFA